MNSHKILHDPSTSAASGYKLEHAKDVSEAYDYVKKKLVQYGDSVVIYVAGKHCNTRILIPFAAVKDRKRFQQDCAEAPKSILLEAGVDDAAIWVKELSKVRGERLQSLSLLNLLLCNILAYY